MGTPKQFWIIPIEPELWPVGRVCKSADGENRVITERKTRPDGSVMCKLKPLSEFN